MGGLEGVNRGDKQCYMRTFRVLAARSNWGPFIVHSSNSLDLNTFNSYTDTLLFFESQVRNFVGGSSGPSCFECAPRDFGIEHLYKSKNGIEESIKRST